MTKLTNYQVDVLADSVYSKVNAKVEQFKTTEEYQTYIEEIKVDKKANLALPIVLSMERIDAELKALTASRQQLVADYRAVGTFQTIFSSVEAYNRNIEITAAAKVYEKFPTLKEIKADIVLASLGDVSDITNTVLTKYDLNE